MGEVTLSTGKVVNIDTSKFTFGEWRNFFSGLDSRKNDNAFLEKATGINPKDIDSMLRDDVRRIVTAILKAGNEPLTDPNSQSESISD